MEPRRIRALLDTRDVTLISKYYHVMDQSVAIRRSPASVLVRNLQGEKTEPRSMMPKNSVKTVELQYDAEEELEAQVFHRVYARYVLASDWSGVILMSQGLCGSH